MQLLPEEYCQSFTLVFSLEVEATRDKDVNKFVLAAKEVLAAGERLLHPLFDFLVSFRGRSTVRLIRSVYCVADMKSLPYFCRGEVVRGFGRGSKELGIPTGELTGGVTKVLNNVHRPYIRRVRCDVIAENVKRMKKGFALFR